MRWLLAKASDSALEEITRIAASGSGQAGFVRVSGKPTVESVAEALITENDSSYDPASVAETVASQLVKNEIAHMELSAGKLCWRTTDPDGSRSRGPQPTSHPDTPEPGQIIAEKIFEMIRTGAVQVGHRMTMPNPTPEAVIDTLLEYHDPDYDPEDIHTTAVGTVILAMKDSVEVSHLADGSTVVRMNNQMAAQGGLTGGGLATIPQFEKNQMEAYERIINALKEGVVIDKSE